MRPSPALLRLSRVGWFALIATAFASKDACFGGGKRPDPPPATPPAPSSSATSQRALPRDHALQALAFAPPRAARD